MKPIALEWVRKAEGDYKIALREMRTKSPVYDVVCFHAQQCLEKYFKALPTEKEIPFPRTHDLAVLLKLAVGVAPGLEGYSEDLSELTAFAVAFRYPGEEATERETLEAVATMKGPEKPFERFCLISNEPPLIHGWGCHKRPLALSALKGVGVLQAALAGSQATLGGPTTRGFMRPQVRLRSA